MNKIEHHYMTAWVRILRDTSRVFGFVLLLFSAFTAPIAWADSGQSASAQQNEEEKDEESDAAAAQKIQPGETALPNVVVHSSITRLFDAVKAENEKSGAISVDKVRELVEDIVMPNVDEQVMSRWVVGKHWRKMSKAQKKEFIGLFKDLLIRTYASSLSEYVYYKINFFPFKHKATKKKATVKMEIERTEGPAVPIQFKLRKSKKGDWKVYDVLVDGISLVANYRSTFASIIKKDGVEGVLKKLRSEKTDAEKGKDTPADLDKSAGKSDEKSDAK